MHRGDAERRASSPRPAAMPVPGEIYLEYTTVAGHLRVVAVDADTGVEVTVVGPPGISQDDISRVAVRKLRRRLAREDAARPGRYA